MLGPGASIRWHAEAPMRAGHAVGFWPQLWGKTAGGVVGRYTLCVTALLIEWDADMHGKAACLSLLRWS